MSTIYTLVDAVIGKEGGYVNHPSDRGGPTRWGVTQVEARHQGYADDMRNYPREMAVALYIRKYWSKPSFATVATVSWPIAAELFDTGINMGPAIAAGFLQKALNGLNSQGKHYGDIVEDADIGPATISALKAYLAKRGKGGEEVMLKALNVLQGARYFDITIARQKNEDFLYGWLANRVEI